MHSTYEIRTMRNKPVYVFDNLDNAKKELARSEKRVGIKLRIVEVMRVEREIEL